MADRTNAKRQAEARAREKASGLKRKTVLLPIARESELDLILARWMREKINSGDDPEMPECIRPLSWLRSMIDACDTSEAANTLGRDDPEAWFEMCREVKTLYERLKAMDDMKEKEEADAQALADPST